MKMYSFDDTAMIGLANDIKERVVAKLESEGLLDPGKKSAVRYAFVLSSRGVLGKLIDKFLKVEDDDLRMLLVEINQPVARAPVAGDRAS